MNLRSGLFILIAAVGCHSPAADLGHEAFPGAAPSLEELGRRALAGLVAADTAGLEALRLTEREHNDVIYPGFPAAASFPVEMAWENISLRNRRDLGRQLSWFLGQEVTYRGTGCRGETLRYESFEAWTDCWVAFDHADHGALEVQLFEDVVVRGGGYKIVRYYDVAPRRLDP